MLINILLWSRGNGVELIRLLEWIGLVTLTVRQRQSGGGHAHLGPGCVHSHAAVEVVHEAAGLSSDVHGAVLSMLPAMLQ